MLDPGVRFLGGTVDFSQKVLKYDKMGTYARGKSQNMHRKPGVHKRGYGTHFGARWYAKRGTVPILELD